MVQSPWTANDRAIARNTGTAGCICFINFAHCVKVHNNICLVNTKFNTLSYLVTRYRFWGPRRFTWFGALSQHNCAPPCQHSLRMSTLILTVSYVYIYTIYVCMYVCIYIYTIYINILDQYINDSMVIPNLHGVIGLQLQYPKNISL